MSTDRELLEAAAKAANNGAVWVETAYEETFKVPYETGNVKGWTPWNPLADDGDALRLAVSVEAEVKFDREREVYVAAGDGWEYPETYAENNGDRCAATRRAIVRAAAAIGGAAS